MTNFICVTCGTQFPGSEVPPPSCPICQDERQYIGPNGQQWTTLKELQLDLHNVIKPVDAGIMGIGTHPEFAIGQRALLVQTPGGNILWDCVSLIDDPTVAAIQALGGIDAIGISHPHFYSSMVEWAHAFDAPIYIHDDERKWVMRLDESVHFWEGEAKQMPGGCTLIRCGGHFSGGQVLLWPHGADGHGALLTGDIITVVPDRGWVSFMYSYPNLIPLPAQHVERIAAAVDRYEFDRIYGGWWGRIISTGAREAVRRSALRYLEAIGPR